MLYKPINIDHSPAHSHPRTQYWKICNGSRRYFWFQSIFQLLKVHGDDLENILPVLETSHDGLTIKTCSVVPLSSFVHNKPNNIYSSDPCGFPQYSMDVSRTKAIIHRQPVDITRKDSSDCSKMYKSLQNNSPRPLQAHQPIRDTPWRQFTINYSAVCCSLEHNKDTNKHAHKHEIQDEDRRSTVGVNTKTKTDCFS